MTTATAAKATPGPWTANGKRIHHLMHDEPLDERNEIAAVPNDNPESLANAALIVKAVNSHAQLLEAIKAAVYILKSDHAWAKTVREMPWYAKAEQAITEAT